MTEASNIYGRALYDLARDEGLSGSVLAQLRALEESFAAEPGFLRLLCAPTIPKPERCRVLDRALKGRAHPYVLNFLKILTEKGYMRQFRGCCACYKTQYDQDNGILPVTAVTAVPLSDALRARLAGKLSAVTGKRIDLRCRVDEKVLGGVRLDFDGRQMDGTVRGRLADIRRILKDTVL